MHDIECTERSIAGVACIITEVTRFSTISWRHPRGGGGSKGAGRCTTPGVPRGPSITGANKN